MMGDFECIIWKVEHGSAAFLRTPNNRTMMLDAGCSENFSPAQHLKKYYNIDSKDNRLYKLIISHPDRDHIRNLPDVMRNQPDEGGTEVLGVPPATLNVAPAIETLARRLVESPTVMVLERDTDNNAAATLTGTVNAIKGYGLKVNVVDSLAASEWVLAANPAIYPVVEMGFFNGNTIPTISFQRSDSDAEFMTGTRYSKCELVFGGAPMSWKTIYKGTNE